MDTSKFHSYRKTSRNSFIWFCHWDCLQIRACAHAQSLWLRRESIFPAGGSLGTGLAGYGGRSHDHLHLPHDGMLRPGKAVVDETQNHQQVPHPPSHRLGLPLDHHGDERLQQGLGVDAHIMRDRGGKADDLNAGPPHQEA